ncbi:MAG TPA: hypothetical protein VHB74_13070 [Devosia sp.]|nr:hypothetical protein [Devosia sp.]
MLVFGDAVDTVEVRTRLDEIVRQGRLAADMPPPQQGWLAAECFVDAAALAQGLIDQEFAISGEDRDSPLRQAATALVLAAARIVAGCADPQDLAGARDRLAALDLPAAVRCKRAEGYAFYALYPEAYLLAARQLPAPPAAIIGIRSIGLGLAALLAAASGSRELLSVRPVGHPFQRRLSLDPAYRIRLGPASGPVAIADEGPGLSGSSFAAVADELAAMEVSEARIHLFPSHGGEPGAEASPANLARWHRLRRHVVGFEELFLAPSSPLPRLDTWFADVAGAAVAPLEDISGGGWRRLAAWRDGEPPAHLQQERLKFRLHTARGACLLKFVGLGRSGREAASRAEALGAAGFTPPMLAFRHGFLLAEWVEGTPLGESRFSRTELIARLADYLGFRARHLPAGPETGATIDELAEMLRVNGLEGLGPAAAPALERLAALRPAYAGRRVMTDNRLHAWEWLVASDGRLLKTDAVDHCAAHDLIGCQDIAWDVAGAAVELALSEAERGELLSRLRHQGVEVDPALLAFFDNCYPAFQLGYYTMAAAAHAGVPEEQVRLQARAGFYRDRLAGRL